MKNNHQGGSREDIVYRESLMALAVVEYPEVSLKTVHQEHQAARDQLAQAIDPAVVRKVEKLSRRIAAA